MICVEMNTQEVFEVKNTVTDLNRMKRHADKFYKAYIRCCRNPVDSDNDALIIPGLVLLSFCCEVYLKAIDISQSQSVDVEKNKIHILKKLYNGLDQELKDRIRLETKSSEDFNGKLKAVSKLFEKSRYLYEKPCSLYVEIQFLERFATACQKVLDEELRNRVANSIL